MHIKNIHPPSNNFKVNFYVHILFFNEDLHTRRVGNIAASKQTKTDNKNVYS